MHQIGEDADDLALHFVGVAAEVAVVEGVPDVVGTVAQEGQHSRIVEALVAGVADGAGVGASRSRAEGRRDALAFESCLASLNAPCVWATLSIDTHQNILIAFPGHPRTRR